MYFPYLSGVELGFLRLLYFLHLFLSYLHFPGEFIGLFYLKCSYTTAFSFTLYI